MRGCKAERQGGRGRATRTTVSLSQSDIGGVSERGSLTLLGLVHAGLASGARRRRTR
jgi:hypothetical protein